MSERPTILPPVPGAPGAPAGSSGPVPVPPIAGAPVLPLPGQPEPLRHPADPDPARSSKASAVLALGVVAVLTGPFVGGVVPATIALLLARQARADLLAAEGYLVGSSRYERGVALAWTGIVLAIAAIVVAIVRGLYLWALTGGDFDPTVK